jgi:hypothetical protein
MRSHVTTAYSGNNIVTPSQRPVGTDINSGVLLINGLLATTLIEGRGTRQLQVNTRRTERLCRVHREPGRRNRHACWGRTRHVAESAPVQCVAAIVFSKRAQCINDTLVKARRGELVCTVTDESASLPRSPRPKQIQLTLSRTCES